MANAQQWKPVTARPVRNIGRSYSFPNTPIPNSTWGDSKYFTLAKKFAPAERCRQLVFWAVDWMSYEDCETAPSAPIDASKYLFSSPLAGQSFNDRMDKCTWCDHHVYAFRNPEKTISFFDPLVPTFATGEVISNPDPANDKRVLNRDGINTQTQVHYDQGPDVINKKTFLGRYGADRNFNGILDRGLLKPSIRLRATTVSRYNFYDPRLTVVFS